MNWPDRFFLIGDSLICKIDMPDDSTGVILVNKDPRKEERKPDCYSGTVTEVGTRCKLVKTGDKIVFTRWQYSQSEVDDERTCLREVDLVIVNGHCVNGFIAVKLYEPFKKTQELIHVETRRIIPRYYFGQIIDIDHSSENFDTKELKENDIILFQFMDEYQFRVGQYTMVFKNMYDVPLLKLEEAPTQLEVLFPESEKEVALNGRN